MNQLTKKYWRQLKKFENIQLYGLSEEFLPKLQKIRLSFAWIMNQLTKKYWWQLKKVTKFENVQIYGLSEEFLPKLQKIRLSFAWIMNQLTKKYWWQLKKVTKVSKFLFYTVLTLKFENVQIYGLSEEFLPKLQKIRLSFAWIMNQLTKKYWWQLKKVTKVTKFLFYTDLTPKFENVQMYGLSEEFLPKLQKIGLSFA
ncbi:hypothetical protein QE152_g7655 [Popillia japonica]|uniref:Uncharacterized protein n=1 Tax=Popillia japonica TaxID=7064 RepID=A0AAW1M9F4_POPJA